MSNTRHLDKRSPNITILGAGAWGTALAVHLAGNHPVCLWSRDTQQMEKIQVTRVNERYLPNVTLPNTIHCTAALKEAVHEAQYILIAVPSAALPSLYNQIKPFLNKEVRLLIATKGLHVETGELLSMWLDTLRLSYGLLSGPSFAKEVAESLPTVLVIASRDKACLNSWHKKLHQPYFQITMSQDVTGVALCGAMKNVIAIGVGIAKGLKLGDNMSAFLITQGLFEMQQLGHVLGASLETFLSAAGIGDVNLTCMSNQSRNRRLGILMGQGLSRFEAQKQLGLLSEGLLNAKALCELAQRNEITLPLCQMVYTVLLDRLSAKEAIGHLINDISLHVAKY